MFKVLALGGLPAEQERLGKPTFPANLEGTEVFQPESVRSFRLRLSPELQLIEILDCYLPIAQAIEQMVAERFGEIRPLNLRHYSP